MDDCSTADIERLRIKINGLALSMAHLQEQVTNELDIRDKMIVLNASLNLMRRSTKMATKKFTGNRFSESISRAMHLTRAFGAAFRNEV